MTFSQSQRPKRADRQPIFLEFPNFGYGPASALLTLTGEVADRFECHVVSTGGAAEFVRAHLPGATFHDLDTFDAANWPTFLEIADPGSLIISCTNPDFAAWTIQRGYRVGLIDTLDWMWPNLPEVLSDAEFHLVQAFFGRPMVAGSERREVVRPIVDSTLWPAADASPRAGTALIGFGGMHLPGGNDMVASYVRWFLATALPILIEHAGVTEITIAGGRADLPELVPSSWRTHPAVRIRPGLDRASYAQLARTAEHLIVSPGLTSIYECTAGRLTPLWQPGFSMSMLLQCRHLLATGYPLVAAWTWLADAVAHVADLPETEGVRHVAERIMATIHDTDPAGETIGKALMHYLERPDDVPALELPIDPRLPDAAALLATHLGRLA